MRNDRFVPVRGEEGSVGVSPFISANSAQYIILENPPRDPAARPIKGNNSSIELLAGRKVVVSGPATFPLWPGQKAKVVGGHELREDEYLVVRAYDTVADTDWAIGTERIVQGSQTSFYVPSTGTEVVPTERGYVRKARRLRHETGNWALHAKFEEWDVGISELSRKFLVRPILVPAFVVFSSRVLWSSAR